MNVPKLRFPEFQDEGEWEEKRLDEMFDFQSTANNSRADLSNAGNTFYIHYGDIHTKFHQYIDFSKDTIPKIPSRLYRNATFLKNGDLVIADASEDTEGIAKAVEVRGLEHGVNAISGLHTILLRDSRQNYVNDFKGLLREIETVKKQIKRLAVGVKVYSVSKTVLKQVLLPLPSHPEQQKIADCLSSIDELITAQTQKLNTLKTHKKGLMQQLFPAEGETLPKLRFPEFQDAPEWEKNLLDSKVIKVGSGITPRGGDKNYKNNGRPFVRSQNVGWGVLLLDDVAYIDEQTHATFPSTEIENGDVLLNITGASIGRCAVADYRIKSGNVNQHVCIIRLKAEELTPEFLNQYLLSQYGQKQIDSFQAGGNRQGLNFAQVRSFVIPHPYRDEQIKVAQFLSSIDDLITAQTQKLATLKTHKKALMQQFFPADGNNHPAPSGHPSRGGE